MGAVALALLVGSFIGCAAENVNPLVDATANNVTEVAKFAKATAEGIDFTASAGYKITETKSGISFTATKDVAKGAIYPFVKAGKAYKFKIENGTKEVATIDILANGGIGELTVKSEKAVGKSVATTWKDDVSKTRVAGKYTVDFKAPTFEGDAAAKVAEWKVEYSYARADGLDVAKAVAISESAVATTYDGTIKFGEAMGSFGVEDNATVTLVTEPVYTAGATQTLDAQGKAWALLAGNEWVVTTQTKVRVQNDNNVWYTMNDKQVSEKVAALGDKVKVSVAYKLNSQNNTKNPSAGYWNNTSGAGATRPTAYSVGEYKDGKYTWKGDFNARESYSVAAATAFTTKDVWTVEGIPGEQVEVSVTSVYNGTAVATKYNYVTKEGVDAGSAWTEPQTKPTATEYFYKGFANNWYKSYDTTKTPAVYNFLDADGKDVYEHAYITNGTNGTKSTKDVVVPTKYFCDAKQYASQNTPKLFTDDSVTIYIKGQQTYNKTIN